MIKDIHTENFCGVTDSKIKDCKRINLLVGKNGVGKTAILERIKRKYENKIIFPDIFAEEYYKDVSEYRSIRRIGFKPQARDLVLNYFKKEEKIFLFEEIENGLHYSVMKDFWLNVIAATIENNVQIFATTHSYEMIEALVEAAKEYDFIEKDEIRLYRLHKNEEGSGVTQFDSWEIDALLKEKREVRGIR